MGDRAPAITLGHHLHFQGQTWLVVAMSGTTVSMQGPSGQLAAVLVTQLVATTDFELLDQPQSSPVPRDSLVEGLDPAQRSRIRRLERHLLQVDTGVLPDDEGSFGDARYNLDTTTVNERVHAKVAELAGTDLAVSVRQFHRLRVAYRADGAVGVVKRSVGE